MKPTQGSQSLKTQIAEGLRKKAQPSFKIVQYLLGKMKSANFETVSAQEIEPAEHASTGQPSHTQLERGLTLSDHASIEHGSDSTQNCTALSHENLFESSFDEAQAEFVELQALLAGSILVQKGAQEKRLLVQSLFQGLLGDTTVHDSIECLLSADKTQFFVFLNDLSASRFTKPTLFNLVEIA